LTHGESAPVPSRPDVNLRFFHAEEIRRPEDVIRHLAKGQQHWSKGYSAFELAHCWIASGGIPVRVRAALDDCPAYHAAELIEGFSERQINLRTRGYPSQTDLMAYLRLKDGYAVAAVEGKVDEPFGDLVAEWNDGSSGRVRRLAGLCDVLRLDPSTVVSLRYPLLHRTVSAIFEAERYKCNRALLLVHSFSRFDSAFADFRPSQMRSVHRSARRGPSRSRQTSLALNCDAFGLKTNHRRDAPAQSKRGHRARQAWPWPEDRSERHSVNKIFPKADGFRIAVLKARDTR
jgi:hypothetical protein